MAFAGGKKKMYKACIALHLAHTMLLLLVSLHCVKYCKISELCHLFNRKRYETLNKKRRSWVIGHCSPTAAARWTRESWERCLASCILSDLSCSSLSCLVGCFFCVFFCPYDSLFSIEEKESGKFCGEPWSIKLTVVSLFRPVLREVAASLWAPISSKETSENLCNHAWNVRAGWNTLCWCYGVHKHTCLSLYCVII